MKAGYIQYDVKRDPDENMKTIESFLKSEDFELAVLPLPTSAESRHTR